MSIKYEVLEFSRANFLYSASNSFLTQEQLGWKLNIYEDLIKNQSKKEDRKSEYLTRNLQIGYLYRYLCNLKADSILIEYNYYSKSFIHDFSLYYSFCLGDYKNLCHRVHFFKSSREKTEEYLEQLLYSPDIENHTDEISDQYLGYVVIKPISGSPVGATLLPSPLEREYGSLKHIEEEPSIQIDGIREYKIHLVSIPITIYTLVTQSQDKATSACASIALWSALHQAGILFQTPILAPSEITRSAGNLYNKEGRNFPNSGLSNNQLGTAIANSGLEREMRTIFQGWKPSTFKGFVYGYLRLGLPVLLGIKINYEELHLVVITGYKFNDNWKGQLNGKKFTLKSDQIELFYCHDDQLGPFAEYKIHSIKKVNKQSNHYHKSKIYFTSPWPSKKKGGGLLPASLDSIIVPVYPLIRIPYEKVWERIKILDSLLQKGKKKKKNADAWDNYWDIFLDESHHLKRELRWYKFDNQTFLKKALSTIMPKYIWRAQLWDNDSMNMELVFDAHGAPESCLLIFAYFPNENFRVELGKFIHEVPDETIPDDTNLGNVSKHLGMTFFKRLKEWQTYTVQ